jgi:hypothetical protein
MNIYKTNFPTEQEGKDYLLSIGVLVETDNEIVFAKDTAAVVYIGKVVKIRLWRFYGVPNRSST